VTETRAFSNKEQSTYDLEAPAEMSFEALSPAYKKMLLVSSLLVIASVITLNLVINFFTTASLQALATDTVMGIVGGITVAVMILCLVLPKLLWKSKGYQLREHDLHYRRGLIWRHVTSLPYVRVQHVELESGPVERYFKLAALKFYTAGGGSADMKIPGLPFGTASKIRSFVMARAGVDEEKVSTEPRTVTETSDTPVS